MLEIINHFFLNVENVLMQIPNMPSFIVKAFIECLKVIPFLYFVYLIVEIIERFILRNVNTFIKITKSTMGLFGAIFAILPECGAQVLASIMFSRRIFTKGMLIGFLIACTDEALPLLFLNGAKQAQYILPTIVINFTVAIIVCLLVDFTSKIMIKEDNLTKDEFTMTMPVDVKGCCSHSMMSDAIPPKWYYHPLHHTFNVFIFSFFIMAFLCWMIEYMGSVEQVAALLQIGTIIQIVYVAGIGVVSNCNSSIFIAIAFVLGLINFPAFAAGMITVNGIAISTLEHQNKRSKTHQTITYIMFIAAVIVGLILQFGGVKF